MNIKKTAGEIWQEYKDGVSFNDRIELYDKVERNENFYIGRQWEGVNAPDLPKPVLNILKRTVAYYISTLCSDDIGTRLRSYTDDEDVKDDLLVYGEEIDRVMENDKTKSKFRDIIRNAAVDGDGCLYFRFDTGVRTGHPVRGEIRSEIVDNVNVIFGNPYDWEVQAQPYIIIALRKPCGEVQDMARKNGVRGWDTITPDSDTRQREVESMNGLTTLLVKMWKEDGGIRAIQTTENIIVREEWMPGGMLYPVAWMNWERVRKCYHGEASITSMIPNQILINKHLAMYSRSVEMNAYPKIVYNKLQFPHGWSNRVGEAIGVNGEVGNAAVQVLRGGDVSSQVMDVTDRIIANTKDSMGATDAALGNINAAQAAASAIIANQQASAAPLELNRRCYYDFVEDCVRIILDQMGTFYGERTVGQERKEQDPMSGEMITKTEKRKVNFDRIPELVKNIEVSVGSSAYWSELMQMQTMDNLLRSGIITDPELYLESVPEKMLPNKQKLIESVKQAKEQQAMAQEGGMAAGTAQQVSENAPLASKNADKFYNSMIGGLL